MMNIFVVWEITQIIKSQIRMKWGWTILHIPSSYKGVVTESETAVQKLKVK